ncbi:MAG: O-antigen ligase family protein [Bacteroidetes bacterium]|nr:O-antigen ligase family protein [Bacteroidota bacterium]
MYAISVIFIALNVYFMLRESYWPLLIPAFALLLYLYFYSLDKILLLIAFMTPLAINMTNPEYGVGLSIPSEPLMAGVLAIFIIKVFYTKDYDRSILKHPVTIVLLLSLAWMFITSLTSQLPLVSFKALVARLWFVVPFYFLGVLLFKNLRNIKSFIWLYTIPLVGVIFYTTYNHYLWGFSEQSGHWVMEPFYNDHTAYGAILTFFIPVFVGFSFTRAYSKTLRFFSFLVLAILVTALVLSFSRAAWVSLAFAFMIYLVIALKIKMKYILLPFGILLCFFFLFQNEIWEKLEKNKQGSSANFVEHVQSISNVTTDDSNLERINRWQSALRMFRERPVFGFGPGTYQFKYAPYQRFSEKTRISTNAGDKGNAHSEYIGPLAESGVLGMAFVLSILIFVIATGLRVYKKTDSREVRMLTLSILLGLITYYFHGTMNDFLDTDKASVPFWGFIAMLVALDIYYLKKPEKTAENLPSEKK